MRQFHMGHFITIVLSLIALTAKGEEALTCSSSDQLSVDYNLCSHKSHKPIYLAQTSERCNSLPLCPNNILTEDETCKVTTNALVTDKNCGVKEYNTCEHIQNYVESENRTCTSKWYDGVGVDQNCTDLWKGSDLCSSSWILKREVKDSGINVTSIVRKWEDQKLITGHRLKASHQCIFTYKVYNPNKVNKAAAVCGVKEYGTCWRPGFSQCRKKEFGLISFSMQQSKECGVRRVTPISQQASPNKRCVKCDHLPKESEERLICLLENKKKGEGLSADMRKKIRTEIFEFLTIQFKQGKVAKADDEDIIRILRTLTDKEYERIVWSFFAGEHKGEYAKYWASIYLSEVVRSERSTSWVFLSKMQQALNDFKYWEADRQVKDVYYLLYDYFVRAYVSELDKLRSDRFRVLELTKFIQGQGKPNTSSITSQAKALGLSDEFILILTNKLKANSANVEMSFLITILSDLSENLKREADQVSDRIKDSIKQFGEDEEHAKFLNVYLDVANLNMRSALLEVRNLSRTLVDEYEWYAGFRIQDNMKMMLVRKIKVTKILMKKLSEENIFCKASSDDLLDLDPALAAFMMQVNISTDQGAQGSECKVVLQTAKELVHKHYLQPLLEIKSVLKDKE